MSLKSFFRRSQSGHSKRRANQGHATRRMRFEMFEDRCMLSFTPAVGYGVGSAPQAVVTADFNNDGHHDLAVANRGSDDVSLLLGSANGSFGAPISSPVGDSPSSIAVGDFDDDGNLDFAAVVAYDVVRDGFGVESVVNVLFGTGDGGFEAPREIDLHDPYYWAKPKSVAVGDFNGDGTMDLALRSDADAYYPNDVYPDAGIAQVLLSNGDRTFASPGGIGTRNGNASSSLVVTDFNDDGDQDLVVGELGLWVLVALGDGAGGFVANDTHEIDMNHGSQIAVGDVNGDGDADVVAANDDTVNVRLGDGVSAFEPPRGGLSYAAGDNSVSIVLGDFDRDGRLDVATANYDSNDVSILRGLGDGTFSAPESIAVGTGDSAAAAVDLNGDGVVDTADYVMWRKTGGTPDQYAAWRANFGKSVESVDPRPFAVTVGDFNGDGWLDIATANNVGNSVSILFNDETWEPLPPAVVVNIGHVAKAEGNGVTTTLFVFMVTLSAAADDPVTMSYRTLNGSAATGWDDPQYNDYVAKTGSLSFAPGETTKTITIEVKADNNIEGDESFFVELFDDGSSSLLISVFGIGTILNDD